MKVEALLHFGEVKRSGRTERAALRLGTVNNVAVANALAPFSAATIEMVCRALGDAVTGGQIPNLLAPLRVTPAPGDGGNTKWKRLFNAVVEAQNRLGDGRPLVRLVIEVMQPVRFGSPEEFEAHRVAVNERFLLSGLEVRDDGKVIRARLASTLGEAQQRADSLRSELVRRNVHPDVLHFCRTELTHHNYFHAVLETCKSVAQKLRDLSGLEGDGTALVDSSCSISSGPVIAFNPLSSDWERSEQAGLAMILKGLFSTYRNVSSHAPKVLWATSREEALDLMTLASMLHRRLDAATVTRLP